MCDCEKRATQEWTEDGTEYIRYWCNCIKQWVVKKVYTGKPNGKCVHDMYGGKK